MKAKKRKQNNNWQNPIATNLLQKYDYEKDILEIIELESENLLANLSIETSSLFKGGFFTPVEDILSYLYNAKTFNSKQTAFAGTIKNTPNHLEINISSSGQHYFRRRFSLAHELGHLVLRQLVSPLTFQEMKQEQFFHQEEETLCNLFASSILMPRNQVSQYLEKDVLITPYLVNKIAKDFKVNREVVLRRIACLTNSILLLWNETFNPRTKDSKKTERIIKVFPNSSVLSDYYIPLFCTADKSRFTPNIILESFIKGDSISGYVKVENLGSLPNGNYKIHNLFFQKWSNTLLINSIVDQPKNFYNMATLIELRSIT
jgi:Zn-dependent peptidase ImmA (M78 family)